MLYINATYESEVASFALHRNDIANSYDDLKSKTIEVILNKYPETYLAATDIYNLSLSITASSNSSHNFVPEDFHTLSEDIYFELYGLAEM